MIASALDAIVMYLKIVERKYGYHSGDGIDLNTKVSGWENHRSLEMRQGLIIVSGDDIICREGDWRFPAKVAKITFYLI